MQDQSKMQFLTSTTGEYSSSEYMRLYESFITSYNKLTYDLNPLLNDKLGRSSCQDETSFLQEKSPIETKNRRLNTINTFLPPKLKEAKNAIKNTPFIDKQNKKEFLNRIHQLEQYLPALKEACQAERSAQLKRLILFQNSVKIETVAINKNTQQLYQNGQSNEQGQPENGSIIRIYNSGRRFKTDDVAIDVDQEEYHRLQELGITGNYDQALTAILINDLGAYRHDIHKKALQFGVITAHIIPKEEICQNAFDRLRALQIVESAYGKNEAELIAKITEYNEKINSLINEQESKINFLKNKIDTENEPEKRRTLHWRFTVAKEQLKVLQADLKKGKALLQELQPNEEHSQAWQLYGLGFIQSEKTQALRGNDKTKGIVERWVRKRCFAIGRGVKRSNELVTLAGANTWGRGRLQSALAHVDYHVRHYTFDQNHSIDSSHQGKFNGKRTVISSQFGNGRERTRKILFAFSCVKNNFSLFQNENGSISDVENIDHIKTVHSRGWGKLFASSEKKIHQEIGKDVDLNKHQKLMKTYFTLRENVNIANESYADAALRLMRNVGEKSIYLATDFFKSIKDHAIKLFELVKEDFNYDIEGKNKEKNPIAQLNDKEKADIQDLVENYVQKNPHFKVEIEKELSLIEQYRKNFDALTKGEANINNPNYIEYLLQCIDNKDQNTAPLFTTPYSFHGWNPRTPFSVIDDFARDFGGFFEKEFETSPTTWSLGMLVYIICGGSTYNPALTLALLKKITLHEVFIKKFIETNQAIATTMSSGKISNFISAGFMGMKLIFFIMDTLANGGDSFAATFLANLRDRAPEVFLILGFSFLTGMGLRLADIPYVSAYLQEEEGKAWYLGDTFAGLKTAGFAYEALHRNPNEKSAVYNSVSTIFNLITTTLRIPFATFFNGIILIVSGVGAIKSEKRRLYAKRAWHNLTRPWRELIDTIVRLAVGGLDFALRISTITLISIKIILKGFAETAFNFAANVTPKPISEGIIRFKHTCAKGWDLLTRTPTNFVRMFRNFYAKLRTREEMYFGDKPQPPSPLYTSTQKIFKQLTQEVSTRIIEAPDNSQSSSSETSEIRGTNHNQQDVPDASHQQPFDSSHSPSLL